MIRRRTGEVETSEGGQGVLSRVLRLDQILSVVVTCCFSLSRIS